MTWRVHGEPTIEAVVAGRDLARAERCDLVVSVGGGSVIDAGKAVAALAANHGEPLDYLEVIGNGRPLERAALPFIAVPTTAGSGAEVTRNAVLTSPGRAVKVSLRSPLMLPAAAIVDPELTYDLPPAVTAATGLDALAQLIEPYLSARSSPLIDPWCLDGIGRAAALAARRRPRRHRTRRRDPTWPSRACWAAWRSPTRRSARSTGSRARSAAASPRRTAPSVPRCFRTCCG